MGAHGQQHSALVRDRGYTAFDRRFLAGDKVCPVVFPFDSHTYPCYWLSETSTLASLTPAMVARRRFDTAEMAVNELSGHGDYTYMITTLTQSCPCYRLTRLALVSCMTMAMVDRRRTVWWCDGGPPATTW